MMRLVAAVAALLLVVCGATGAFAHASLVATEPRDGSMVAQAPKTVRLRFNEPVTPAVIRVIDSEGTMRDDAAVHAADETIEITLPDGLARGHAGDQLSGHFGGWASRCRLDDVFRRHGQVGGGAVQFRCHAWHADLAVADRPLSRAVRWRRRRVFQCVDRRYPHPFETGRGGPGARSRQRGRIVGMSGARSAWTSNQGHPDPRALASRDRDHARAVARHCRRGDGP